MKTVLLVEDHPSVLDHLTANAATIFGDAELTVVCDADGVAALPDNLSFDIGLVDPGLPGIAHDSLTDRVGAAVPLLQRIRSADAAAVFTGIASEQERLMFMDAGFEHYFSKANTGVRELADFFSGAAPRPTPPESITKTWTFLTDSELEAHTLNTENPDSSYNDLAMRSGKSLEAFSQALKRARRKIRERSG